MSPFAALGLLLAVLALAFVLHPVLKPSPSAADPLPPADELAARRRALYQQILDLEFDQRVGKLDEADARELSEALLRQAAALLASERAEEREIEAEIEREIQTARRDLAAARDLDLGR
jgi:hypothetical protein